MHSPDSNGGRLPQLKMSDIFLSKGMFNQEQLDEACELQKTDDMPIGKVLISLGYLTYEDLALALGGIVAGWGKLELHERGFKCGVAKILAVFAPHPRRTHPHYGELALENWAALERICAGTDIPLLPPDALSDDAEVRRYARERDLVLLEVQLLT